MKTLSLCLFLSLAASCAGTRTSGDHMTSHAEAFNLFGMSLMGDDYEEAWSQVPDGANVISVATTPKDWTSVFGIMGSIMGVSSTQVSWTK